MAHSSAETATTTIPAPTRSPILGPANLQTSSISQYRTLTNAAVHGDYSYVKGVNNLKAGVAIRDTFLREHDNFSIVDNLFNAPCVDSITGEPIYGYPRSAAATGPARSRTPIIHYPALAPYDLTRGGNEYDYFGHTDVKELALYIEDQIKAGNWIFNLGMRDDLYNGLTVASQPEPRVGIGYNIKPSATVLAVSYARTMETPFNENLVLSSNGCTNQVLAPLLSCAWGIRFENSCSLGSATSFMPICNRHSENTQWSAANTSGSTPTTPSTSASSATRQSPFPLTGIIPRFPVMPFVARCPNYHEFSAYYVMSSVAARFFPPQIAGAGSKSGVSSSTALSSSASITMRSSTRLRIFNTPSTMTAGPMVCGPASTGAMTPAWWLDPLHAMT